MKPFQLPRELTISGLRRMYASKEATPRQVIAEILKRADRDKEMNIWITPPAIEHIEPYLAKLDSLDPASSPLWGIPFAIKDNIDLAGIPTTAGCAEYAYTPDDSAEVVARLTAAGAIPLGKTNLDQFATGLVGTRSPYGETRNSLREDLISGGSSSGSAVAVACGQAAFALGTDTAGSGRVPAALNRLVGFKPSLGAWPTKGLVPACASLDCITVFTHSLADALSVDSIARGVDVTDPWSRRVPHPKARQPALIYLPRGPLEFFGPYAEDYRQAWEASVMALEKLKIPVDYIDTDLFAEAAEILYGGPLVAERWASLGGFVEEYPDAIFPVTAQVLRTGAATRYTAASVFQAMHKLQRLKLAAGGLLKDAVLVMPTCGGTWTRDQVRENPVSTNSDMGRYTNHCNLLDLSAVAVPSCDAAAGLPFGITLFGLSGEEGMICEAAEWFVETAAGHAAVDHSAAPEAAAAMEEAATLVAVCGLHMRGFPLEKQMRACGARFVRETASAAKYKLVKLPTAPAKPGMIKVNDGGSAVLLEVWEMPLAAFGSFAASIPAPLGIGKVELEDGTEVPGFVCEGYALSGAEDITASGGWRNHMMK